MTDVPPIGLRPTDIAWLEFDRKRAQEIGEAITRYAAALVPIPEEWFEELKELINRNQPEDKEQQCAPSSLN